MTRGEVAEWSKAAVLKTVFRFSPNSLKLPPILDKIFSVSGEINDKKKNSQHGAAISVKVGGGESLAGILRRLGFKKKSRGQADTLRTAGPTGKSTHPVGPAY